MSAIRFREFAHVDALRAMAVLLVVFSHAGFTWLPGGAGVTIFFVISGFIISHLLFVERERTGSFSVKGFYARRAWKLAPPLLVVIVIPTLIYATFEPVDPLAFGSQVFFGYNWVSIANPEASDLVLPGSGVTWSLAIEEQFYITFAIIWLLLVVGRAPLKTLWWLVGTVAVGSTLWRVLVAASGASDMRVERGTDTRIDALAMGIMVALVFANWRAHRWLKLKSAVARSPWLLIAAALMFLFSLAVREEIFQLTFKYTLQQAAVAVVILYGLSSPSGQVSQWFQRVMAMKSLQITGLASYSIYLAHLPMKYLIDHLWGTPSGPLGVALWQLVVGFGGLLVGLGVWRALEVPLEAWRRRNRSVSDESTQNQALGRG